MPIAVLEAEKRQTLFFTTNDEDKLWRLKEKLVAVAEAYLQERDDVFTVSSVSARDVVGDLEQIDVAFTTMGDPSGLFSFVEVRDRAKKVGRNYIQEIIGKQISLGVKTCKVVSTREFTRNAKRLATHRGIPLRLLVAETVDSAVHWYRSDVMHLERKLWRIVECIAIARTGDQQCEVHALEDEILEKKFIVPSEKTGTFRMIPIPTVFEIEVLRHTEADSRLFENIPVDGELHAVPPITVRFDHAQLYLRIQDLPVDIVNETSEDLFPVEAVCFLVTVGKCTENGEVVGRYQYLDAISQERLADLALARFEIGDIPQYLCLLRCRFTDQDCQIGGVFFE